MKYLFVILTLSLTSVYANDVHSTRKSKDHNDVQNILKDDKKDRKKKAEICHECGKPEVNCDCEGEEHRKDK